VHLQVRSVFAAIEEVSTDMSLRNMPLTWSLTSATTAGIDTDHLQYLDHPNRAESIGMSRRSRDAYAADYVVNPIIPNEIIR